MENGQMTGIQVLEITRDMLQNINVPVALLDQVGRPVRRAVGNLNTLIRAMKENENQKAETNDKPEGENKE